MTTIPLPELSASPQLALVAKICRALQEQAEKCDVLVLVGSNQVFWDIIADAVERQIMEGRRDP